jgi:hypothetical protein
MYRSIVSCNPRAKGFLLTPFQSSIFLWISQAAVFAYHELQNRTYPNFSSPEPHLNTFILADYRAALKGQTLS